MAPARDERQAELLAAFLEGRLDEAADAEFAELLRRQPELAAELRQQLALDSVLRVKTGHFPRREGMLEAVAARLESPSVPRAWRLPPVRLRTVVLAAAACLVFAVTARLVTAPRPPANLGPALAGVLEYRGKVLASGLGGKQFLMYGGNRLATVEPGGQARLRLLPDGGFLAVAPESQITLLGTPAALVIHLEAGGVEVQAAHAEPLLTVLGDLATVSLGAARCRITRHGPERRVDGVPGPLLEVQVFEGLAAVKNEVGGLRVTAGESAWVAAGREPWIPGQPPLVGTPLPPEARGFAGTLRGTVAAVYAAHAVLAVDAVEAAAGSRAANPQVLVGLRLAIALPEGRAQALPARSARAGERVAWRAREDQGRLLLDGTL